MKSKSPLLSLTFLRSASTAALPRPSLLHCSLAATWLVSTPSSATTLVVYGVTGAEGCAVKSVTPVQTCISCNQHITTDTHTHSNGGSKQATPCEQSGEQALGLVGSSTAWGMCARWACS